MKAAADLKFTFKQEQQSLEYDPKKGPLTYLGVSVQAWANGRPLIREGTNAHFDLAALLSHGLRGGQIHLYNCSCGVPYCLQVQEPAHQIVQGENLYWRFSADHYQNLLNPEVFENSSFLTLSLRKEQVHYALTQAVQYLEELENSAGLRVVVQPDKGWPNQGLSVEQVLRQAWRKHSKQKPSAT